VFWNSSSASEERTLRGAVAAFMELQLCSKRRA
jgi:hypothetical protein